MTDTIFAAVPGRLVVAVQSDDAHTFRLRIDDVLDATGISTGVQVGQRVAAQMQVTLDQSLFVTAFGDDPGQMRVTMVHGMQCGAGNGGGTSSVIDSVQQALAWYRTNKLQGSNLNPITLAIGASVFKGYVMGFELDAQAAEGGMVRSQLSLAAWNVA